jgi:hypothetical protein
VRTLADAQLWNGSRITFRGHVGLLVRQYTGDQAVNVAFGGTNVMAAIENATPTASMAAASLGPRRQEVRRDIGSRMRDHL